MTDRKRIIFNDRIGDVAFRVYRYPEPGDDSFVGDEPRLSLVVLDLPHGNDIYNEVIDPLAKEGADVRCDVVIIAKGDAAIRENTVELGIRERLIQRGITQTFRRVENGGADCSRPSADVESLAVGEDFPGFVEVHHERDLPSVFVRLSRDRLLFRGAG